MAVGRKTKKVTFLSSEVSGKAQKYTRVGPREFVRIRWGGTLHWRDQSSFRKTFFIFIRTQGIVVWYFGWWAGTILSLNEAHSRFQGDPRKIHQVIQFTYLAVGIDSNALVNLWLLRVQAARTQKTGHKTRVRLMVNSNFRRVCPFRIWWSVEAC